MLAYVFWHRPREGTPADAYEQAQIAFHRSLARTPPVGFGGSACHRAAELPWLDGAAGYEDWYFVEDYTALGVLNEAAVGHAHRTPHDEIARRFGGGAGGLYGLIEGTPLPDSTSVCWVARPPGSPRPALEEMLADGIDPLRASLWRRQLVLGPAPEYCLLGADAPAGIAATRLPQGWTTVSIARERLAI